MAAKLSDFLGPIAVSQSVPFTPPPSMMCNIFSMANPKCRGCPHAMPHFKDPNCHTKDNTHACGGQRAYCVEVSYKLKFEE